MNEFVRLFQLYDIFLCRQWKKKQHLSNVVCSYFYPLLKYSISLNKYEILRNIQDLFFLIATYWYFCLRISMRWLISHKTKPNQALKPSSSCRATSRDIPDPLSPLLPIVHHLWQVFLTTSRILTELLNVCSYWSSCFCTAICGGP